MSDLQRRIERLESQRPPQNPGDGVTYVAHVRGKTILGRVYPRAASNRRGWPWAK